MICLLFGLSLPMGFCVLDTCEMQKWRVRRPFFFHLNLSFPFWFFFRFFFSRLIPADCTGANPISDTSPTTSVTSKRRGGSGGTTKKREWGRNKKNFRCSISSPAWSHKSVRWTPHSAVYIALVFIFFHFQAAHSPIIPLLSFLASNCFQVHPTLWYTFSEVPQLSCCTTDSNN